jgi:hypothetical protein
MSSPQSPRTAEQTALEQNYPEVVRALREALDGGKRRRAALMKHLRFFMAFVTRGSYSAAVEHLGLDGQDERHGQVRYHIKRLTTVLHLDREPHAGLVAVTDPKRPRVLTDAGQALQQWVSANPELLAE